MKASLGLLAGLTACILAENCDPIAYEQSNPYGLAETKDPKVVEKLDEYLSDTRCHMRSDGIEDDVKEQCKNVCIPGDSTAEGQIVVSSQSCIFGDNPWYPLGGLHPLLCGEDKTYNGEFFIEGLIEAGKILEKVLCPALKALDVVMAIGMAALPPPGRAITGGMVAAIRSAKAYKYAHEAQDAAQEWADFFLSGADFAGQAGCDSPVPSREELIKKVFTPLVDAPDELVPDDSANVLYETEHVLEWQTVVEFFNTVDKEIETKYHHPNPTTNEMVGFCKYWSEHWTYKLNLIDGPSADPAVSPDADAAPDPTDITDLSTGQLVPVHWLAIVYPYREGGEEKWLEEMPLLEKRINGNYKARDKTNSGEYEDIVAKDRMQALIEGRTTERNYRSLSPRDQSRLAIQRLRPMTGTFKYMQEDTIAKTFANQKNRIGAMIGHIDRELHRTPRQYVPTRFNNLKEPVDALPWQEQGLEDKWDAYMDNVVAVAKKRAADFMELHLDSLKAEWESSKKTEVSKDFVGNAHAKENRKKELEQEQKDMLALIKKAGNEWDKVKDWKKPTNWKAKDEQDPGEEEAD
ncbi:uncharacterized protein J4E84_007589 [Alternaria hordeiaustralica]|uniref:uncharacterized protein n=1 Tax=Alternaria hordeiaustralica TaxID=1187925 RepID=UPI0020C2731D|nr:uncharacterized protein J4E84_007589 [Alternaria hordeiaustralica]KAI4681353.1 hypothetical protein J4E84_007589 [Alternaria hordeiaustralica]